MTVSYDPMALSPDLEARIQSELKSGERVVWAGQPRAGRFIVASLPVVFFGIPWTAFAVFWMYMASGGIWKGKRPHALGDLPFLIFPLFGLPFVLIGLAMLSAPYWARRIARRTCYALTDRRAIIWEPSGIGATQVRIYLPEALGSLVRRERPDGSGDLVFEEVTRIGNNGRRGSLRRGFLGIESVREVEELLQRTLHPQGTLERARQG